MPTPPSGPLDEVEIAKRFLRLILPEEGDGYGDGYYVAAIRTRRGFKHVFATNVEELWGVIESADRDEFDTFHACASFKEPFSDPQGTPPGQRRFGRTKHNVLHVKVFFLDIDVGPEKVYLDLSHAAAALAAFCNTLKLPSPIIVRSGSGLHAYWPLQQTLDPDTWQCYATGLKNLCQLHGLHVDPARTADISSVLRTPGTRNRKRKKAVEFDPEYLEKIHPYAIEQFKIFAAHADKPRSSKHATAVLVLPDKIPEYLVRDKPAHIAGAMQQVSTHVSASGLQVAESCEQVRALRQSKGNLMEPLWYATIGVLAFCQDGDELAHEWSRGDPRYTAAETQERLDRARTLSGATTCERFHFLNPASCERCPLWGKIKSPITLGRDNRSPAAPTTNGAAKGNGAPPPPELLPWEYIARTNVLKPKSYANTHNVVVQLGLRCSHDIFHDRKIVEGDVIENLGPQLSDAICRAVREFIIHKFRFDPGPENTQEVLERACERNRFNPILDYLDSLKWDGQPRLDRWLTAYMSVADTELNRAFGRLVLIAAVRRVRTPGTKFDQILVLEGPEGTEKSKAIEILAGEDNFSDQTILVKDDRTQMELLQGVWIFEIADLAGMKKSDVDKLKAFASRKRDRSRLAYAHFLTEQSRHTIFIGTTNEKIYLRSQTGNRRFWPVLTGHINTDALSRDRDQLWAEAAYMEAKEESLVLPEPLWAAARVEQEQRQEQDPWDDLLADVKGEVYPIGDTPSGEGYEERISSIDLLRRKLVLPIDRIGDRETKRLGHCMRRLGWEGPKRMRINNQNVRGYYRKCIQ